MDGKGEKEGKKKWKYMLHDPRIGNPTYPRAARREDKEGRGREKERGREEKNTF